jgi:anhydro-N-acetylmuramic acid kinase
MLENAFAPIPVRPASAYDLDPDAKEALCFAVLAHETVNGAPTNLPSVTGASDATLLGSISVPA